ARGSRDRSRAHGWAVVRPHPDVRLVGVRIRRGHRQCEHRRHRHPFRVRSEGGCRMIAAFTRLDLSSWFLRTQTALTLLLVVAVGILLPVPGMAIIAAALVTSLMVSAPFLADEREHLNTLYGVLPVSRRTVVTGRALSIVTYYIAAAALATLVTVISATVRGGRIEPEVLLIAHAVGVA